MAMSVRSARIILPVAGVCVPWALYSDTTASKIGTAAAAKKQMIVIARRGTTITHEIIGQCGSAIVLLKPASEGTGVIASGAVRAVCDGAGITNILTKCHRSNNPINVVKATFDGLSRLKAARSALPLPTGKQETGDIPNASPSITQS